MSEAQSLKFCWPGLKKSLQTQNNLGYVTLPFVEAPFGERLKYVRELPEAGIIASINAQDIPIVEKYLAEHTCILVRCPNITKV